VRQKALNLGTLKM